MRLVFSRMDFQITPFIGDSPIIPEEIQVRITTPKFEEYAKKLVEEAKKIVAIRTPEDAAKLNSVQGEITAALGQIEAVRKLVKRPVLDLEHAIDASADSVSSPLETQKLRLSDFLTALGNAEADRRKSEEREVQEKRKREIEAKQAEILRLQEEKQKTEIDARGMELFEAGTARAKARDLELQEAEAAFEEEMLRQSPVVLPKFHGPLVPGARTAETISIDITNRIKFLENQTALSVMSLAEIELKKSVAKDKFKETRKQLIEQGSTTAEKEAIEQFADFGITVTVSHVSQVKGSSKVIRNP
jgi:hypothetical protein